MLHDATIKLIKPSLSLINNLLSFPGYLALRGLYSPPAVDTLMVSLEISLNTLTSELLEKY